MKAAKHTNSSNLFVKRLGIEASGRPIPTIKWQKPLGHLPRGRTAVIDGNMTILSVTKEDTGTYVCSVKNLLGLRFGHDNSD